MANTRITCLEDQIEKTKEAQKAEKKSGKKRKKATKVKE